MNDISKKDEAEPHDQTHRESTHLHSDCLRLKMEGDKIIVVFEEAEEEEIQLQIVDQKSVEKVVFEESTPGLSRHVDTHRDLFQANVDYDREDLKAGSQGNKLE